MVSMHRARDLAERLKTNRTLVGQIAYMAWNDGGVQMIEAVAEFAGVSLDAMLDEGGIRKNFERARGTAPAQSRTKDGFHRPGAHEDVRRAAHQMGRKW